MSRCESELMEYCLQGDVLLLQRVCRRPWSLHLLRGMHYTLAVSSMVVVLPLPHWSCLCWFNAVNLPMCVLVSMGMDSDSKLQASSVEVGWEGMG